MTKKMLGRYQKFKKVQIQGYGDMKAVQPNKEIFI